MFDGLTPEDIALITQRNCDNCGKPFEIDRPIEAPHKRFCSAHCRDQYHYKRAKAKRAAQRLDREATEAYKAWQQAKYKGQSNA